MSVSKDRGSQISLLKFGVVCVKENGVNTKVEKLTFLTRSTIFQIQFFPSKTEARMFSFGQHRHGQHKITFVKQFCFENKSNFY